MANKLALVLELTIATDTIELNARTVALGKDKPVTELAVVLPLAAANDCSVKISPTDGVMLTTQNKVPDVRPVFNLRVAPVAPVKLMFETVAADPSKLVAVALVLNKLVTVAFDTIADAEVKPVLRVRVPDDIVV